MLQPGLVLNIENDLWNSTDVSEMWGHKVFQEVFDAAGWSYTSQIDLTLTDDESIQKLNAAYRQRDVATNVLSFPLLVFDTPGHPIENTAEYSLLGDIVLAYETVMRESQGAGIGFCDHATHLIVHGGLHLLGYDHEQDDEAEIMESLETHILEKLGIKNPYK